MSLIVPLLLVLSACSAVGDPDDAAGTTSPPLTGLTATIYQSRMDVGIRQVKVRLQNDGPQDVTLGSVRLESTAFEAPMTYDTRHNLLSTGRAVALPVPLSAAVCPAQKARHVVHVDYEVDGRSGVLEVEAVDEGGRIAELQESECFTAEVAQTATMSITDPPTVRSLGEALVADVVVRLTPGSDAGPLAIGPVSGTTLLQHVDPVTGERLPQGSPIDLVIPPAPSSFSFTVVPNRCDAHAVAEDKQGTMFPVHVRLEDGAGMIRVDATSAVTTALYEFVASACAP